MYSERPVVAEKGLQNEVSFSFVFGQKGGPKRHLACSTNHRLSKYTQFVCLFFVLSHTASVRSMAMASVIDSEATFEQQASEAGLSQPWIDALKNNSMATMAKLSFAITTPGTTPY